jgi:predicted dehydrogenase
MLRIGLIGAGWHATADHAPALRHCADDDEFRERVELAGVCDIDPAKATALIEQFGFRRAYDSIDAMLPDVDAVFAIVPSATMMATLQPIIQHSRPVLIEKPFGRDIDEARRIGQMLDNHPHMVSLNRRFDPGVAIAKQWLGQQSPPTVVLASMTRQNRLEPDFAWGTGIHLTDLVCFLFGPIQLTRGHRRGRSRYGVVERAGKVFMSIEMRPAADREDESVKCAGDDWFATLTTGARQPWEVHAHAEHADPLHSSADPATPEYVRNGTVAETAAFLRGVLSNGMTGPTVADAMPGTELAAAMQTANDPPPIVETLQ